MGQGPYEKNSGKTKGIFPGFQTFKTSGPRENTIFSEYCIEKTNYSEYYSAI
jgi:hypothetical protein